MQSNLAKKIEKMLSAFSKIDKFPKAIIKHGSRISLLLLAVGTFMVVYNHTAINYDPHLEFIAQCLVKTSFTVLAEAIIGGLVMDFVFKKG
ncbi:MAG TPA: hypothetical protein GXX14_13125 [Clostridiaceae bacterium]|nr:hypothetical protein [Clostridiaceae bacterium]